MALEEMWKSVEEEGEDEGLDEGGVGFGGGVVGVDNEQGNGEMMMGLQLSSNHHHLNHNLNHNYNFGGSGRVVEVLDEEFLASEGGVEGRWSGISCGGGGNGGSWVAPGWEGVFGGDANGNIRAAKNKASSRGRRKVEQDWKGYLKRKGAEWLFI